MNICTINAAALATAILLAPAVAPAQSAGAFSFGKPKAETAGPAATEVVEVYATGHGADVDSARKDAVRNAIKKAVGELVGSKTLVENDALVEDRILTLSNAMVEEAYYGDAKSIGDGLFEVPVKALVKKGQLNQELEKVGVSKGAFAGESLAAKLFSGKERIANAEKFLAERFKDFPGNVVEGVMLAKADGTPDIEVDDKTGHVFANVGLRVNMENYLKWTQGLCEVLGQMCIEQEKVNSAFNDTGSKMGVYGASVKSLVSEIPLKQIPPLKTYGTSDSQRKEPLAVIVATPSAQSVKRSSWPTTIYYLDSKMFQAFCKQAAMRCQEREKGTVEVVLKDKDDGPVCSGKGSLEVMSYLRFLHDNTSRSVLSGLLPIKTFNRRDIDYPYAVVAPVLAMHVALSRSVESFGLHVNRSASQTWKMRLDLGEVEEDDLAEVTAYEVKVDYPPPRPEFGKED